MEGMTGRRSLLSLIPSFWSNWDQVLVRYHWEGLRGSLGLYDSPLIYDTDSMKTGSSRRLVVSGLSAGHTKEQKSSSPV